MKIAALEAVKEIKNRLLGDTLQHRLIQLVRDIDAEVYYRALSRAKQLYPGFAL